jgi:hypothetical protein
MTIVVNIFDTFSNTHLEILFWHVMLLWGFLQVFVIKIPHLPKILPEKNSGPYFVAVTQQIQTGHFGHLRSTVLGKFVIIQMISDSSRNIFQR